MYLTDPTNPIFESTSFFNTNLPLHNRVDPNDIIVIGDSAGGALALSLTFYLKDHLKVPLTANPETKRDIPSALPSNLILVSPWLDLSCSFDSWARNDGSDYIFRLDFDMDIHHESSKNPIFWYTLGKSNQKRKWFKDNSKYSSNHEIENIQRILSHPLMSPFFHTKLSGMPRVLIQAGGAEVLIDETVIMAKKLSFHNPGRVRHELFHDMPHVFVFFVMTLAGKQGFVNSRLFVEGNLKNGSDLFKVDSFDNEIFDKVEKEDSKLDLETNF